MTWEPFQPCKIELFSGFLLLRWVMRRLKFWEQGHDLLGKIHALICHDILAPVSFELNISSFSQRWIGG